MVRHALSEARKKLDEGDKKEQAYLKAIAEYKAEQAKPEGEPRKGLREVAGKYKISPTGLGKHVKGGKSIQENNVAKQLLTEAEERKILELRIPNLLRFRYFTGTRKR
ncbi:hypothetical protein SCHPADRAFT_896822, partial [Schizopora paradoxa]